MFSMIVLKDCYGVSQGVKASAPWTLLIPSPSDEECVLYFSVYYKCVSNESVHCLKKEWLDILTGVQRHHWCKRTRQQKVIFGWSELSFTSLGRLWSCLFCFHFHFSQNLIIYETPNLIKFYTCLVWELTFFFSQTSCLNADAMKYFNIIGYGIFFNKEITKPLWSFNHAYW